ncbi:ribosome maturation factor RimM [Alphaproteobacteria bacterium]|nr:ribosome maturation factor RimM [Alphaproteobacteria bacterium]
MVPAVKIRAAHGVRGLVKIQPLVDNLALVFDSNGLFAPDGRRFALSPHGSGLAEIAGVATREEADALRGLVLSLPRDRLPPLPEGEYYHADLIGKIVMRADGSRAGTLAAMHNFGAGDIMEIAPADGAPTFMLPFAFAASIAAAITLISYEESEEPRP